jgi:hypothetical protein
MFMQLAGIVGVPAALTQFRPSQLSEYLESFWNSPRSPIRQGAMGPGVLAPDHEEMARPDVIDPLVGFVMPPAPVPQVDWHHIVYAYMLENTRMVDIFRRVVFEWLHGERLPLPGFATQRWLHCTEHLFFGSPWSYSVTSVTSALRPDYGAVRRNAYYRMLGMDLNHGSDDGNPYSYLKADAANREFAQVFEAFVSEVWRAFANVLNVGGENPTDDNAIEALAQRIREMMQARRLSGALSREEFSAVALTSWLETTLQPLSPVVADLNCDAPSAADRLMRIGALVGIPAHARSDAYLQLAAPMSNVLLYIETTPGLVAADFYNGFYTPDMLQIVTQWSVATGRNIKDPTARQPISNVLRSLSVPAPVTAPAGAYPSPVAGGTGAGNRVGAFMR